MKETTLDSWEAFETSLKELFEHRLSLKENASSLVSDLLFRGQSASEYKLLTTLDRYVDRDMHLYDYYRAIYAAKPQVETFTNQEWEIPRLEDYESWCNKIELGSLDKIKAYEYMAYLRHHGFPSPLLDWTGSPYLAAFFAFDHVDSKVEYVSVYAYLEDAGSGKSTGSDKPWIQLLGPYVKTHARHFMQQSRYTICKKIVGDAVYYAKHEDVFSQDDDKQDLLWKFNIPSSERITALRKLELMNINAYSLFGSEESLMNTVAKREFLIRDKKL